MQEGLRTPPGALGCLGGQSREEPTGVRSSSPCPHGRSSPHAKLDKLYFHLPNSERSCLATRPALPVHAFPLWHLTIQGTSLLLPRPPSWALGPVEQDRAPSPSLQDPVCRPVSCTWAWTLGPRVLPSPPCALSGAVKYVLRATAAWAVPEHCVSFCRELSPVLFINKVVDLNHPSRYFI